MRSFSLLDYSIVVVYIVASLGIGLRFATKQHNVEDYFVAARSGRWWAVAISAVATGLSAISYMGVPGWVFAHDLQLNVAVFLLPLAMIIVMYLFVPLLARLRLMTIYEYLEIRFNVAVRTFASSLFLILRGGWLATAIYTQSLLLAELSGLHLWACVGIVGVLTAAYTVMGGMEAVLWTDVMQFFVLVGGLIAMLVTVLIAFQGDATEIFRIAHANGNTKWIDPSFSLVQLTFWGIMIGTMVDYVSTYGSDQVMVQRFLTSPDVKSMRRSVMFTGLITVPVVVLLALVGLALFAYYQTHPQVRESLAGPDRVVPHFVINVLPTGVAGLVVAGVFAATMSTLSAGFNSLATATVVDFFQRFRRTPPRNATSDLKLARVVTMGWALISTVVALFLGRMGKGIVETFGIISGLFIGPVLGIFLLGILTRRPGASAALTAIVAGTAATWWVSTTEVVWVWYAPVGCFTTLLAGVVGGLILPPSPLVRSPRVAVDATGG